MGWGPIRGPLLLVFRLPRVVYAIDALLALAFAEGTLAAIALAIAFALSTGLAVALSAVFSLTFAWLLVLASALARAEGGTVAFAPAIRADFGTRFAAHTGRGWTQPLRVAGAKAIVALQWRSCAGVLAFALALPEGVELTAVLGGRVRGPRRR